ncbi:MAG: hypothetical protein KJO07_14710 [Deltaproteobacteria bacterium]|nr:hypothetical protein [Deltaproteobacteria bacterium]
MIALIGGGFIFLIGILVLVARFYRKVDQGRALIINKMSAEPEVTFTGGVVLPVFHRSEVMDISVKSIEIDRRGKDGLICQDNIRADIKVTFFVRVNKTKEDVMQVAQSIGCARASDLQTLEELFNAKFSEALKTVGKKKDFESLYTERDEFKSEIIGVIGKDLNGYVLDDAAIDYLEQTPLDSLDKDNILDAQGIRKITEITTQANVRTNELKQRERMEVGSQDLAADEAIYRFDQQRAAALAKRDREIAEAQSRETNEAERVRLDETKETQVKQAKLEEEIVLANIAKQRASEVAEQARMREVEVEKVRVGKATDLEQVEREREVTLRGIERDKQVEVEKKEIANVVSQRISVEKAVAQEEENIKDLRVKSEAHRQREVTVVAADAQAEELAIQEVKKAEAAEKVAQAQARVTLVEADADLEAADKKARSKIRLAEGVQAEEAAAGLAKVRVREADAAAIEKQGVAEVKVREAGVEITQREGLVEAKIIEEKGLAEAKALEARAEASEKQGLADAVAKREQLMAEVIVKEAEASAVEKLMRAEAAGLAEKAQAMKQLEGEAREHEEFRLKLEKELELRLATLKSKVEMATKQAEVMGSAMQKADINIVGGDGAFFDKFVKAVSLGHSIDGVIDSSDTVRGLLGSHLNGDGNILADIKDLIAGSGMSSETVKNLTVSAVLGKLMTDADGATKSKLKMLIDKAEELGVDKVSSS